MIRGFMFKFILCYVTKKLIIIIAGPIICTYIEFKQNRNPSFSKI